jgi:hypothetical protein
VKITLNSVNLKMFVYICGKYDPKNVEYDMKIPPTNPGFMGPEPATIVAVTTLS